MSCASHAPERAAATPDAARIQKDVTWLADDAREGRRAGTESCKKAGEYLAKRFEEIGLEPAGEHGWFQEFQVPLDPRDAGSSMIRGAGEWYAPDVVPLFCSEGGTVEARVVFAGFGIVDEERGWNDYANKDVKGAIVFIVRGTPDKDATPKTPAEDTALVSKDKSWGSGASIFTKIMTAKRFGAVGVILAPPPTDTGGELLRFDSGHAARAGIPALMVQPRVGQALFPGFERALDTAGADCAAAVRDVTLRADVVRGNGPAYNVLARLRGASSAKTVVVGAHYDHLGHGGTGSLAPAESGSIHNGADDNASGTATVLEIARLLKARGTPPGDVVFALWSGEELGLLGSEYWAEHPTVPLASVIANLNLDMVGRAGNGKLQVLGAGTSPEFASWMPSAAEQSGLELTVSTTGGALGGSSDHQSFLKREIPALHLFSGLHADYHKPSDDTERFEAAGAAKVAELGATLVDEMLAADELAFVAPKVDPKAQPEIKGGFRAWFGSIPSYSYEGRGVLLDGTSGGSPAERAGFLKGDILVQVGEVVIDTIYDFTYALQLYKPGDVVLTKYLRDGKQEEVRVTLSTRAVE